MLTLLLFLAQLSHADCVKVVPYRSLGAYHLGDKVPGNFTPEDLIRVGPTTWWRHAGYRIRAAAADKIDMIQHVLPAGGCFRVNGTKLTAGAKEGEVKKLLRGCELPQVIGPTTLLCDGFTVLWMPVQKNGKIVDMTLRIDVSMDDRESARAARAASKATFEVERASRGIPLPKKK